MSNTTNTATVYLSREHARGDALTRSMAPTLSGQIVGEMPADWTRRYSKNGGRAMLCRTAEGRAFVASAPSLALAPVAPLAGEPTIGHEGGTLAARVVDRDARTNAGLRAA